MCIHINNKYTSMHTHTYIYEYIHNIYICAHEIVCYGTPINLIGYLFYIVLCSPGVHYNKYK